MTGLKMLVMRLVVWFLGFGIILASGGSSAHQQHGIKRAGYQQPSADTQILESVTSSEVEYVDGPLAPLYDFLIQRRLQRFCKLLRDARIEEILLDLGGSWTLFAPTDASFIFLPGGTLDELQKNPQLLQDFVLYHFVAGDFPSTLIKNEMLVDTVKGLPLRFNIYGQTITVSGAQILEADLVFELGRVYIVDRPLYPMPTMDTLSYLQRNHQQMYKLIVDVGLVEYISSGTVTILVPDDEAFSYLSVDLTDAMATNISLAERIILNHILPGSVYVGGVSDGIQWETVGGNQITFTVKRGLTFVNDIPIIQSDIPLTNGVIHVINRVLLPEGVEADCQCKPSSNTNQRSGSQVPGSSRPSFGQTQRPQFGQGPAARRPIQSVSRQTPRPFESQTPGTSGISGQIRPSVSQGRHQNPNTSDRPSGNRPWSSSRTAPTIKPLSPPAQITRSPHVSAPGDSQSEDDLNSVVETGEQLIPGQKRTDGTRPSRYPPPLPPQRRPLPQIIPTHTRTPPEKSHPLPDNENNPQDVTTEDVQTPRPADRWSNRQRTPAPRYPTPERVSYRTPATTRRPQTTRTYDWNKPKVTQAAFEQPGRNTGIDFTTTKPLQEIQTQRQTPSWQQRKQITLTTKQPTQRTTFRPSRVSHQPHKTATRTSIPPARLHPTNDQSFDSNRQKSCRQPGERVSPSTQNLPICSGSQPDGCQNSVYDPTDPRPKCPDSIRPECRESNEPYDPADNRPQCQSPISSQDCRAFGQPTYIGDRRPLCSHSSVPQTGCKDPSAPSNPSDRRPLCRPNPPERVPTTTDEINTNQECREFGQPTYIGDRRPICPPSSVPQTGCKDPSAPSNPSDRRPFCRPISPDAVPPDTGKINTNQECREFGQPTYIGDRRPICPPSSVPQTGCKDPSAPSNPSDRRPFCRPISPATVPPATGEINTNQECRELGQPTYIGDRRPLCSPTSVTQTGCKDSSEPFNPSDRIPPCRKSTIATLPPDTEEIDTSQGCRMPGEIANPQDRRPQCPDEPQEDCRPFLERPRPGDRRPVCKSPQRQPKPNKDSDKDQKKQIKPEQQPTYPQRGQYPQTTRKQSWQLTTKVSQGSLSSTRAPQSWQSTRAPQSWQSTRAPQSWQSTRAPQSWQTTTARQPIGKQPQPVTIQAHQQPQSGSFQTNPQTESHQSQPGSVSQPQSSSYPTGPASGTIPSHPQSGRHPSQTQSGRYPSNQQSGRHPSHQQKGTFQTQPQRGPHPSPPSSPQSGSHASQPQSGSYPSGPHSGTYPSQPQSETYPSRPHSGSHHSEPAQLPQISQPHTGSHQFEGQPEAPSSQPHSGTHASQPQSGSYPSQPHSGGQISSPQIGSSRPYQPQSDHGASQPGRPTTGYPQRQPGSHQSQSRFTTPSTQTRGVSQPGSSDVRPNQSFGQQGRPVSGHGHQSGSFTTSPRQPTTTRIPISVTGTSTTPGEDSRRTLYEIVEDPALLIRGRPVKLTKIFALFHKAGLDNILTGPGPTTVFLPSDDAFSTLPQGVVEQLEENPELLRQVLSYHVTQSEILPSTEGESYTVPSLEGHQLLITMINGGRLIIISGAKAVAVTKANNGIFYVINQLLYPLPHHDIVGAIQSRPDLSTLALLLPMSGLVDLLQGQTPYTLLAPTDNAFAQLPQVVYDELTRNTTALQELLLNHIIEGAHYGREFLTGGTFPSARGGKLKFQVVSYGYQVNEVNIKTPEIITGTGVIHLVDQVLLEDSDLRFITNLENSVAGEDGSITNPQQPGVGGQAGPGRPIPVGPRPVSGHRLPSSHQPGVNQPQVGGLQPALGQQTPGSQISGHGQRIPGHQRTPSHPQNPGQTFGGQQQPNIGSPARPTHGQQTPRQPSGPSSFGGRHQPSTPGTGQPGHGQSQPLGQPEQQIHGQQLPGQLGHTSSGGHRVSTHGQRTQTGIYTGQRQPAIQTVGHVSGGHQDHRTFQSGGQTNDVAELARTMGLNQFANWVTNTGLLEKIHDGGVYTVFAPTDDAVNSLPEDMVNSIESNPEQVRSILQYHILPQRLNLNSVTNEETASTLLDGKTIRFNVYQNSQPDCKQLVTASGTPVGESLATMGSIQVIPVTQVLYQPAGNLLKIVEASPILQKLNEAVKSARLTWVLSGSGPVTIFAPSDTAFDALTVEQRKALVEDKQAFSDLLKRHMVRGTFFSSGIQDDIEKKSENNKPINLSLHEGILTVNSVPVTFSDITATNGVLHVIDHFL